MSIPSISSLLYSPLLPTLSLFIFLLTFILSSLHSLIFFIFLSIIFPSFLHSVLPFTYPLTPPTFHLTHPSTSFIPLSLLVTPSKPPPFHFIPPSTSFIPLSQSFDLSLTPTSTFPPLSYPRVHPLLLFPLIFTFLAAPFSTVC